MCLIGQCSLSTILVCVCVVLEKNAQCTECTVFICKLFRQSRDLEKLQPVKSVFSLFCYHLLCARSEPSPLALLCPLSAPQIPIPCGKLILSLMSDLKMHSLQWMCYFQQGNTFLILNLLKFCPLLKWSKASAGRLSRFGGVRKQTSKSMQNVLVRSSAKAGIVSFF